MANQQSLTSFQEVHKKIQEARERISKERERYGARRTGKVVAEGVHTRPSTRGDGTLKARLD